MEVVAGLIKKAIDDNASCAIDQEEYNAHYNGLVERYEKNKGLDLLQAERMSGISRPDVLSGFLFEIMELPDMDLVFNENRFGKTVDHITSIRRWQVGFHFLRRQGYNRRNLRLQDCNAFSLLSLCNLTYIFYNWLYND